MKLTQNSFLAKVPVVRRISKAKTQFHLSRNDKIIVSTHAIFEGVGIAGLISAAFWYTTAPISPDGFKGPIATYTIATTTIISLFLAIPIASFAFKKLIADMDSLYNDLRNEARKYIYLYDELIYELLKLRSLFFSDSVFRKFLKPVMDQDGLVVTELEVLAVCQKYKTLDDSYFAIAWDKSSKVVKVKEAATALDDALSFLELLRDRELSTNLSIKKSLLYFIKKRFSEHDIDYEAVIDETHLLATKPKYWRNVLYGIASGVACAEVLLSICWTVISILIGVGAILPISNSTWAIYAVSCIFSGILFGLGMGLSRHKQKTVQSLFIKLKDRNDLLVKAVENLNNRFIEKSFKERTIKSTEVEC